MTMVHFDDQIIEKKDVYYYAFTFSDTFTYHELEEGMTLELLGETFHVQNKQLFVSGKLWEGEVIRNEQGKVVLREKVHVKTIYPPTLPVTFNKSQSATFPMTKDVKVTTVPSEEDYHIFVTTDLDVAYFRGKRVHHVDESFQVGDMLIIDGISVERGRKQWKVTGITKDVDFNQKGFVVLPPQSEYPQDFPESRRSPRIFRVPPKEDVVISLPKVVEEPAKGQLLKTALPPLMMVGMMGLTSFLSGGNPIMMLGMGGMSLLTTTMSISSHVTNKRTYKEKVRNREESYDIYLLQKQGELNKLAQAQRAALNHHYPDMETVAKLAVTYNGRIYERMTTNEDFLDISLGTATLPTTYDIQFEADEKTEDELITWTRDKIIEPRRLLKDVPLSTKLLNETIGLAGRYPVLRTAVSTLLLQIATFHSYHDVGFVALVPEEHYEKDWHKWRWLPHFQIRSLNLRGFVRNARSRDMLLNSFYQLLVKRRQEVREAGTDKPKFKPHYILTILDDSHLAGHGLNEFLAEDMSPYGVTVIWGKEAPSMLPETVTTLVQYVSAHATELVNENNVYVAKSFKPHGLPVETSLVSAIQRLANLEHMEVEKNTIPESVTFLDMYNVKEVEELNVFSRWKKANTAKTLAVPLGLRGKDDIVELNLHERAHGPHGLIAGTTGSGKSEIVQSYILSLAIHFAPEDVGFLPIDFKGGGMANEFKGLPHLLGSITNLDGASSARALASIRAELKKRQKRFSAYGVNHINAYTKLYKKGKEENVADDTYPTEPLPHLFLISDEFAELKANEPDFMAELVSIARIGRSLGVHLILATQKPSGVVDDQIWSNSRFKLALKVADESDSNEIIKTPDAASIVEPGRAYLQVGNNEIYELFQSAWSGATYDPNATIANKVDERIWEIDDLGQYRLLSTDLSDDVVTQAVKKEDLPTQLKAVVAHIAKVAEETSAILPEKPWLPPLEEMIVTPEINREVAWQEEKNLKVPWALLDRPSAQEQVEFLFDFEVFGHTLLLSSAGFGKSTAIQTLVMNLARENNPEQVHFYLLDFSTNGLLPLKDLPHTADLARLDETEKLLKMVEKIRVLLEERKQTFQVAGVSSLEQYEQKTGNVLPILVLALDGFDSITESDHRDQVETMLNQVLREGASLGIYLILSANQTSSIRMAMMSNITTKIVFYMVDESDVIGLLGKDRLTQQNIVGRAQIQLDEPLMMQMYLPNGGESSLSIISSLLQEIEVMKDSWFGAVPESLPVVPLEFDLDEFNENQAVQSWQTEASLPLGLALKDTRPVGYLLEKHSFFLMVYTLEEQLESQQMLLMDQLPFKGEYKQYMTDFEGDYGGMHGQFDVVFQDDSSDIDDVKALLHSYTNGETEEKAILYISDLESFIKKTFISEADLKLTLNRAAKHGLYLIIHSLETYVGRSFDLTVKAVRESAKVGIVSARVTDTQLLADVGRTSEPQLNNNEAYYFEAQGRRFEKIRMPGLM